MFKKESDLYTSSGKFIVRNRFERISNRESSNYNYINRKKTPPTISVGKTKNSILENIETNDYEIVLRRYKENRKVIGYVSSIGTYCGESDNEYIAMLPDIIETVSNIFDDPRSDIYIKILCNMCLASFVLNGRKNEKLLKPCFVGLKILKKIISTCDVRIVYENITSHEKINKITLELDNLIRGCQTQVNWRVALEEVGYIGFCSFFDDKYDWYSQYEERMGAERDKIILYVKFTDLIEDFEPQDLFDDEEYYANTLAFFAERGILRSLSRVTPNNFNMISYLKKENEMKVESELSIFSLYVFDILSMNENTITDLDLRDTLIETIDFITTSYGDYADWKEKIALNSALAYMISPRRYISEKTPMSDDLDILTYLVSSASTIAKDSKFVSENKSNPHKFLSELDYMELKLHQLVTNRYDTTVLFDILSRQALQNTEKIIDWIYSTETAEKKDFETFFKIERGNILHLTRMMDKNLGDAPKYKNRLCISSSINYDLMSVVDEINERINAHSLLSIRKMRQSNRLKLDLEEDRFNDRT